VDGTVHEKSQVSGGNRTEEHNPSTLATKEHLPLLLPRLPDSVGSNTRERAPAPKAERRPEDESCKQSSFWEQSSFLIQEGSVCGEGWEVKPRTQLVTAVNFPHAKGLR